MRELGRLCRQLLDFHTQAWAAVMKREWWELISEWPGQEREKLHELLAGTGTLARQASAACQEASRTLAELQRGVRAGRGG